MSSLLSHHTSSVPQLSRSMSSTSQRSDMSDWIDVRQEMTPSTAGSPWATSSSSSSSSSSRPSFADILRAGNASKNESTSSTSRLIAYAEPAPSSNQQQKQRPESPMEQFSPFDSVAPSPFELSRENSEIVWVPSPRERQEVPAHEIAEGEESNQEYNHDHPDIEDLESNEQDAFDSARSFDNDAEYNASYTSLGDFYLPPPKKSVVQFRILHSPDGENVSNKLFRARHRELANFVVKEVPRHPKRRNYGIEHDYSYYHTKESSERLQFQAQNEQRRLAAIAKLKPHAHHMYPNLREENQPTSSSAPPVVASPYQTTLPKSATSYEQTREESEPANAALRRALAQVEESLAITAPHLIATRPVMLNASASHQTLLADRYARQQAAKQAQAKRELIHSGKESGSSVGSGVRRSVAKVKPQRPPKHHSWYYSRTFTEPQPNERFTLVPSVARGFEAFRAQFWKRYQGEITKSFSHYDKSYHVTSIRLCTVAQKVRDAFMGRLNSAAPLADDDIKLCYFGESAAVMEHILAHGITQPPPRLSYRDPPNPLGIRYWSRVMSNSGLLIADLDIANTIPWAKDVSTIFVCACDMRDVNRESAVFTASPWFQRPSSEIIFSSPSRLMPLFFLDFEANQPSIQLTEKETPPPISPRTARILLDKWNAKARQSARGISERQPQHRVDGAAATEEEYM